jgi:hypothetical protein
MPTTTRRTTATPRKAAPARPAAAAPGKANARSLHIGLNLVDPRAYGGWDGPLAACENDARDMATLARSQGVRTPAVLLTRQATRKAVLARLRAAANALKAGGFFFLSFSGHGGQVPDTNRDERDRQDETWCLWDGQLIDDELYLELARFAEGVRIVVLSDSCHSGSVTRDRLPPAPPPGMRSKLMPPAVQQRVATEHRAFYEALQADVARQARALKAPVDPDAALAALGHTGASAQAATLVGAFKPAVLLISGCQDNQTALDGEHNGAFTEALLKVWNRGAFEGPYGSFHARIRARLPATQSPNLYTLGPAKAVGALLAQRPFTV